MGQPAAASAEYHIFAGSAHAYSTDTWSHGEQFAKSDCAGILAYSSASRRISG
jgi:hypothetical protein